MKREKKLDLIRLAILFIVGMIIATGCCLLPAIVNTIVLVIYTILILHFASVSKWLMPKLENLFENEKY